MGVLCERRRRVGLVAVTVMAAAWGIGPAGAVPGGAPTVKPAIASGRLHSCGLTASATVVCWGDNSYGELGNNSTVQSLVPVQVHGVHDAGFLRNVTAIAAGNGFSCAQLTAGTVDCWGYGGGDLGFGTTGRSLVPVQVHGFHNRGLLTGVTAITAGDGFACALLETRTAVCWGADGKGQLGNFSTARSLVPVQVHGIGNVGVLRDVTAIAAGSARSPCALLADRTMACWGYNGNGELGNNSTVRSSIPVRVHGVGNAGTLSGVSAVTGAGSDSSCAVLSDTSLDCWGYNGSLGVDSAPGTSLTPVQVHGVKNDGFLSGVAAASDHSDSPCALLVDGTVACWGYNTGDKLGDSHVNGNGVVPVQVHTVADAGVLSGNRDLGRRALVVCAPDRRDRRLLGLQHERRVG